MNGKALHAENKIHNIQIRKIQKLIKDLGKQISIFVLGKPIKNRKIKKYIYPIDDHRKERQPCDSNQVLRRSDRPVEIRKDNNKISLRIIR